ncbi:MAG: TetR/AcrR family transcriptional regulator [Rhizonema sp. PD38]|nr:TetR/AcrR family transcriptional regulator [Rhizonema sp. PD38]
MTKKSKTQCATREIILQAACQVIIAHGAEAMTLEAVAREAGVSKGGLLYHFPNKEALIAEMMNQLVELRLSRIQQAFDQDDTPETVGRWVRAYIRSFTDLNQEMIALHYSLLAAILFNPKLLAPLQQVTDDWQQQMEASGLSPERVTLIRLALDGLYFANIFGFTPPNESLRTKMIEELLKLAEPE